MILESLFTDIFIHYYHLTYYLYRMSLIITYILHIHVLPMLYFIRLWTKNILDLRRFIN